MMQKKYPFLFISNTNDILEISFLVTLDLFLLFLCVSTEVEIKIRANKTKRGTKLPALGPLSPKNYISFLPAPVLFLFFLRLTSIAEGKTITNKMKRENTLPFFGPLSSKIHCAQASRLRTNTVLL